MLRQNEEEAQPMAQSPAILVVGTTCSEPAKDEEFSRWYTEVHVPEVLKVPGILSAERFECIDAPSDFPKYLAIYELADEQAVKGFKNHLKRQKAGEIPDFTWGPKFDIKVFKAFKRIPPKKK